MYKKSKKPKNKNKKINQLTLSQVSVIIEKLDKPNYNGNTQKNSLYYKHIQERIDRLSI